MKKERLEDKIIEPLAKLCVNHIKQTECILKCDNISINFWNMERNSLLENEPSKIFKKKHLEWETKLNEVTEHLKDLYKSKEEIIEDLNDFSTQWTNKSM